MFLLQYGPIAHIDLKIPPRPPGYAFVEVSVVSLSALSSYVCVLIYHSSRNSLKRLVTLKMLFVGVMAMTSMGTGCGLVFLFEFFSSILVIDLLKFIYALKSTQVELAHGGRGHSSSTDRLSGNSGSRGPRGGVSRRSEYRGGYISYSEC